MPGRREVWWANAHRKHRVGVSDKAALRVRKAAELERPLRSNNRASSAERPATANMHAPNDRRQSMRDEGPRTAREMDWPAEKHQDCG